MLNILLSCLLEPPKGVKQAFKAKLSDGYIVLIAGIIVAALLGGLSAAMTSNAMGSVYAMYGMQQPDFFSTLGDGFTSSVAAMAVSFAGITVSIYALMRALGHVKGFKKLVAGAAFPFVAVNLAIGAIELVSVLTIPSLGDLMGYALALVGYVMFLALVWMYILFALSAKEHYGVSLEKAAAVVILAIVLLNLGSLMSMLGSAAGSVTA